MQNKPKFEVVHIATAEEMQAAALKTQGYVDKAVAAHVKTKGHIDAAFKAARTFMMANIPSGLGANQRAYDEYHRKGTAQATILFEGGISTAKDAQTVKNQLVKQCRDEGYVPPLVEKSEDEKVIAKNKAEATRKAKERKIVAFKAAIKKANPKVEADDLQTLAVEKYDAYIAEGADKEKQQKRNEKARTLLGELKEYVTANDCGDGDTKELLAAFVSVDTLIKGLL